MGNSSNEGDGNDHDADATRSQPPVVALGKTHPERAAITVRSGDTLVDEPESYEVEEQIGAGGMGTVLAAKGSRLSRPVAVKIVTADREDLRRRFAREAQVTARLQHPAIVPVYGSGRTSSGHPFYVMKQVTGEALDRTIGKSETLAARIALLPNVIAVAEAIAYAHAQHVIHRDLKPANILVGAFGETVVIDWGLAKDLSRADGDDAADAVTPYRATPGVDADADATAMGKVMGTPAYMPLEQARGEAVDARADVYALGAILYHLLAGRSPFVRDGEQSVPWESMLARVLTAAPPPLAELVPDAPPELVAVVSRAMARAPDDRYATASELAADLKRFQTGQLVGAHRYSSWQLLRRWIRRHRAAVVAGSAALVVVAVVGSVSISNVIAARDVAEAERERAKRSRDDAESLIGFMVGDLQDKLAPVGRVDALESASQKVLDYYERQSELPDNAAKLKRAAAYRHVAAVFVSRGRLDDARKALASAIALDEQVHDAEGYGEAAISRLALAETLDPGPTRMLECRAGLALAERALATDAADLDFLTNVAHGHDCVGTTLARTGDTAGSLAEARAALALRQRVADGNPEPKSQIGLITAHFNIGQQLQSAGDNEGALREYQAAARVFDTILARNPADFENRQQLAVVESSIAGLYHLMKDKDRAIEHYRIAIAAHTAATTHDPENLEWKVGLAIVHQKLAMMLASTDDALAELAVARAIAEDLVSREPKNTRWRRTLRANLGYSGVRLRNAKRYPEAIDTLLRAVALAERIHAEVSNADTAADLATMYGDLGKTYASMPTHDEEALVALTKRLEIWSGLHTKDLTNAYYEQMTAASLNGVATAQMKLLRFDAAATNFEQALVTFDAVVSRPKSDPYARQIQATIHENLGTIYRVTDRTRARSEYAAAKTLIDRIVASGYSDEDLPALTKRIDAALLALK